MNFYRVQDIVLARQWIRAAWRDGTKVHVVIAPTRDVVLNYDSNAEAVVALDKLSAWLVVAR